MDDAKYAQLVRFAKSCLPNGAFLEPSDLVSDAFIKVGCEDVEELKKVIRSLAYDQRGFQGFVNIEHINYKDNSLVETSQICKQCDKEKGFDGFKTITKKGRPIGHDSTCKTCRASNKWNRLKATPDKYQAYLVGQRVRDSRHNAKKKAQQPNSWQSVLLRIKSQISPNDWNILSQQLNDFQLIPEALQPPKVESDTRPWKHSEIETLFEDFETLTPQQIGVKLKRDQMEVIEMMISQGLKDPDTEDNSPDE